MDNMDYGKTNDSIRHLQGRLTKFGAEPGKIDGHFGEKTKTALKRVQRYYHGEGHGVMNAWTYEKMYRRKPPR
jgi:peptidoglycan hydrolase-like protein with peptidoglycan-binding domain